MKVWLVESIDYIDYVPQTYIHSVHKSKAGAKREVNRLWDECDDGDHVYRKVKYKVKP